MSKIILCMQIIYCHAAPFCILIFHRTCYTSTIRILMIAGKQAVKEHFPLILVNLSNGPDIPKALFNLSLPFAKVIMSQRNIPEALTEGN